LYSPLGEGVQVTAIWLPEVLYGLLKISKRPLFFSQPPVEPQPKAHQEQQRAARTPGRVVGQERKEFLHFDLSNI
jgi:hypothetical protein